MSSYLSKHGDVWQHHLHHVRGDLIVVQDAAHTGGQETYYTLINENTSYET